MCFPTTGDEIKALRAELDELKAVSAKSTEENGELSKKLEDSEAARTKLEDELRELKETNLTEIDGRIKALEDFDVDTLKTEFKGAEEKLPGVRAFLLYFDVVLVVSKNLYYGARLSGRSKVRKFFA